MRHPRAVTSLACVAGGRLCLPLWGRGRRFGVCFDRRVLSHEGVCSDPQYIAAACGMVAEMVECLPSVLALGHKRNSHTPAFLTPVLRNIIISLARLPLVNSYTRVPPLVSQALPWHRARMRQALGSPRLGGPEQEASSWLL